MQDREEDSGHLLPGDEGFPSWMTNTHILCLGRHFTPVCRVLSSARIPSAEIEPKGWRTVKTESNRSNSANEVVADGRQRREGRREVPAGGAVPKALPGRQQGAERPVVGGVLRGHRVQPQARHDGASRPCSQALGRPWSNAHLRRGVHGGFTGVVGGDLLRLCRATAAIHGRAGRPARPPRAVGAPFRDPRPIETGQRLHGGAPAATPARGGSG